MKYDDAKLRQMLAAEYVLGTLIGRARRRFGKLAARDAALQDEVNFWEMRLGQLALTVPPVEPPRSVWLSLQHRISLDVPKVTPLRAPPASPSKAGERPASPWRIVAGLAVAAGVVLAVLVGNRQEQPVLPADPAAEAPVAAAPTPPAAPSLTYVSLLKIPDSTLQWALSLNPERGTVTAVASGEYAELGEHSLQLWLITEAGPVSLGLLPLTGEAGLTLPNTISDEMLTLAISLEPIGGSPTGQPTGKVLTSGPAVKAA